jgi:hypothetical protein
MNYTFNTNIAQWATLQKALAEKKMEFWDVTSQWDRTEYKDKHAPVKPFAMILLKGCKKVVILVWRSTRYAVIEAGVKTSKTTDSINKIITGIEEILPPPCAAGKGSHKA